MTKAPVPPHNHDAEESILGALMLSPRTLDTVTEVIQPDDFYRPSHGLIYATAREMYDTGRAVDAITLTAELEARGKLKDAGGRARIHELAQLVPSTANAPHYARIIRNLSTARAVISAGQELIRLASENPGGDAPELLAQAESVVDRALEASITTKPDELAANFDELWQAIDEAYTTKKPRTGLLTGYLDLDTTLTGLHPGTLTLLAARPGFGKSALALNVAENTADRSIPVAFYSLEMSREQLQIRSLARVAEVDSRKIQTGLLSSDEYEKVKKAIPKVKNRPKLLATVNASLTPHELRSSVRQMHRRERLGIVIVDYLQLMVATAKTADNRAQELASISRSLKVLALELGVPVLALSQLNRNLEGREEKRPRLSDLRESGSLEQDADAVLMLYRDDYYKPESPDKGITEVIVAKNRMGPTDTVRLTHTQRYSSFKNLARSKP